MPNKRPSINENKKPVNFDVISTPKIEAKRKIKSSLNISVMPCKPEMNKKINPQNNPYSKLASNNITILFLSIIVYLFFVNLTCSEKETTVEIVEN